MYPLSVSIWTFPTWAQQLMSILPLSALIEFIDVITKLHVFELNGSVPLWSWPVTPPGARLLLSPEDGTNACCLDRPTRRADLHCIDGRYGNCYPSSTSATTRLYITAKKTNIKVENMSPNMAEKGLRTQSLDIFIVCDQEPVASKWSSLRASRILNDCFPGRRPKYWLLSGVGWLCITGMAVTSILAGWYIATAYLVLMPFTGFIVQLTHGGSPRRLLDQPISPWPRLVVVTNSLNDFEWFAFYGRSSTLDSLLNKPIFKASSTPAPNALRHLIRLLIAGQWILAVVASTQQDWNAGFISFWIFFCSAVSTYGYQPWESVEDWLQYTCSIHTKRIHAKFSTRRSMLSALLYLNPDSKNKCTDWIDPILSNKQERHEWESTALTFINTDSRVNENMKGKYWWKYLVEGFEVAQEIKKFLNAQSEKEHKAVSRDCLA